MTRSTVGVLMAGDSRLTLTQDGFCSMTTCVPPAAVNVVGGKFCQVPSEPFVLSDEIWKVSLLVTAMPAFHQLTRTVWGF